MLRPTHFLRKEGPKRVENLNRTLGASNGMERDSPLQRADTRLTTSAGRVSNVKEERFPVPVEYLIRLLVTTAIILIFLASQMFWLRQIRLAGDRLIPNPVVRNWIGGIAAILFIALFAFNASNGFWARGATESTELTLEAALLHAPFRWWVVGSVLGFLLIALLAIADRLVRGAAWLFRRLRPIPAAQADPPLVSSGRRRFLEQTAVAVGAVPFFAGAYGLFIGRLNLQTTHHRLLLNRLPKAFHGFRIAQVSDIHIGPFMPGEEIKRYVAIVNALRPDLIVLTGDYLTWDPSTQKPVVEALAGLRAPHGVVGCLGNHEMWSEVEDSLTRLFAEAGFRMLRQEQALIESGGEVLNVVGVDFQTRRRMGPPGMGIVPQYLTRVEHFVRPGTANILLCHNPNPFDRAAEIGYDLTLAGHTHGGQVTLEFIHPSLTPSRLITDYVSGYFSKPGVASGSTAHLYVNRGIGTIAVPMRLGAPPEISVFELTREA